MAKVSLPALGDGFSASEVHAFLLRLELVAEVRCIRERYTSRASCEQASLVQPVEWRRDGAGEAGEQGTGAIEKSYRTLKTFSGAPLSYFQGRSGASSGPSELETDLRLPFADLPARRTAFCARRRRTVAKEISLGFR